MIVFEMFELLRAKKYKKAIILTIIIMATVFFFSGSSPFTSALQTPEGFPLKTMKEFDDFQQNKTKQYVLVLITVKYIIIFSLS